MRKHKVQYQHGYNLAALFKTYAMEIQCIDTLFKFVYPACTSISYCSLKSTKRYQCHYYHHQISVTANTLFESAKSPLTIWLLSVYLITPSNSVMSALSLKRQIAISCNTAWCIKQKIMQIMKEQDDKWPLSGVVKIDDDGGPERVCKEQFIMLNTLIANVKNSIIGTYSSIKAKYLSRYFAEYC